MSRWTDVLLASGTLLVLLTWAVAGLIIISVGLLPTSLTAGRSDDRSIVVRGALWWGLLLLAITAYAVNLAVPLHSTTAGEVLLLLLVALGIPGWWLLRSRRPRSGARRWGWLHLASVLAVGTLAVAALGPVTNYDSGLYHLQAIRYAADFPTVTGLANVYFPLGYSNAEFPLAALMGVGPWGLDGYRLLNGLVIAVALLDLVVRAREPRRGAGFFILLTGMTVVVITMLPLADYWVTSPTQDSTVFAVTVVATAYLADAITKERWTVSAGVVMALSILSVLLRPTMAVFAVAALAAVALVAWHRRARPRTEASWVAAVTVAAGVLAGIVATARDYRLSGWLQYPLSIVAFDVPWLAADPTDPRTATLGAARDPDDLWAAAEGWEWIPAWFSRLPSQWESYAFLLLVVAAVTVLAIASRQATLRWRALSVVLLPSLAATAFWWLFTPPSFRFAWGSVFTLGTIPFGWALWRLVAARHLRLPKAATVIAPAAMIAIVVITLVVRIDYASMSQRQEWHLGVTIPYAVAPVTPGDVTEAINPAGLEFLMPTEGEQCWLAFPTCSPQMAGTVRLRGADIADGYLP